MEEIEYTEEDINDLQNTVDLAREITEFVDTNETFKKLVKMYTEDYALTQLHLAQNYEGQSAARFVEKFKARANFLNFLNEIREDGNNALMTLHELKNNSEDGQ